MFLETAAGAISSWRRATQRVPRVQPVAGTAEVRPNTRMDGNALDRAKLFRLGLDLFGSKQSGRSPLPGRRVILAAASRGPGPLTTQTRGSGRIVTCT
jgi:hypothetical protein